jgi:hypothetical protein
MPGSSNTHGSLLTFKSVFGVPCEQVNGACYMPALAVAKHWPVGLVLCCGVQIKALCISQA